ALRGLLVVPLGIVRRVRPRDRPAGTTSGALPLARLPRLPGPRGHADRRSPDREVAPRGGGRGGAAVPVAELRGGGELALSHRGGRVLLPHRGGRAAAQ